jgi:hypothetical protein
MTNPRRYLTRMIVFVVAVAVIVVGLSATLLQAFRANPELNGFIVGVLVLGIGYIFHQVWSLNREVAWIESFRTGQPGMSVQASPRLLAPMSAMLGERGQKFSLSAMAMRSLLDGISSRLDEKRDISRYLIGLLIFLGLLGTFYGLIQTIESVADVIGGLTVQSGDLGGVFDKLKSGLEKPLQGMGTAFSTSLFGLAGSLVLGFLELQAGQAQNIFYNDLEDWLSGQTRLSSGSLVADGEGGGGVPAYVQALLEQSADSLESLQRTIDRGEESRITANNNITNLAEKLSMLTDQMRTEQSLMMKLAESQLELKPILSRLAEGQASGGFGDDGVRSHVRNIDVHLARLHEELATGRAETVQELRTEIRVLSRTLAAIAEKAAR